MATSDQNTSEGSAPRSRAADRARAAVEAGPGGPRRPGPMRRVAHRWLLRMSRPYGGYQQEVNERLIEAIDRLDRRVEDQERLDVTALTSDLMAALESLRERVAGADELFEAARAAPASPFAEYRDPVAGVVLGYRKGSPEFDPDEVLGGSDEAPRRLEVYKRLLEGKEPVHELVNEASWLSAIPGGLGGLIATGVLDRSAELERFMQAARDKLEPGGILVADAVNPHAQHALKTFWSDPDRRRPVFPEAALALCRRVGFSQAYVFHPLGSGHVDDDRRREGVYAVVATA